MKEKIIMYSFDAWTKSKGNKLLNSDCIQLYDENLEDLIDKIKLFNKVACFECWTSLKFFKWEITFFDYDNIDKKIIDTCYFPKMISAHKIEVWGKTYEI